MAQMLGPAFLQSLNAGAVPLSGGKLFVYQSGTTTPIPLYSDDTLAAPTTNPLEADAAGVFPVAYTSEIRVKVIQQTSAGVTVRSADPIYTVGRADNLTAADVSFDGTASGLASDNLQDAVDEVVTLQGLSQSWTTASDGVIATGTSTNSGAGAGPEIDLYRNSASPAASDVIGGTRHSGKNAAGTKTIYTQDRSVITDTTNGSEDAERVLQTRVAGALADRLHVGAGAWMDGATGGDKGIGSFNAATLYEQESRVLTAATYASTTVYTGSTTDNLDYPIGTCLHVDISSTVNRNHTATIRLSGTHSFSTGGAGSILTGTWRCRGAVSNNGGAGDQAQQMFQRTA
jgi:hypothetical protein